MLDLFGNEHPAPAPIAAKPIALNLFDAASERAAMVSGRPVSQERCELFGTTVDSVTVPAQNTFSL